MDSHTAPDGDAVKDKLTSTLPVLKIYALSLTGDDRLAADLLQDTLVKVLSHSHRYIYHANFRGWATTIMHNIFVNERSRASRSIAVGDEQIFDSEYNDTFIEAKDIAAAIATLSHEHRTAFTMFVDGYRYEEISTALGVPLGTVKSRIYTARMRLQRMLKDYVR